MYKSSLLFCSYNTTIRPYGFNTKLYSVLYTAIQHPTKSMHWYYRYGDYDNTFTTNPARSSVPTIRQYNSTVPTETSLVFSIRQYNTRQSQCTGSTATAITTIRLQQIQLYILFLQYVNTAVRFQQKAL